MGNASNLDKHFILVNDINASGTKTWNGGAGFEPVAKDTSSSNGFQGTKFTGYLDGRGYKIINLFITHGSSHYVGLFGYLGSGGMISNVSILDINVSGNRYIGGLVGYSYHGTVDNCYATGNFIGGHYVGGLVGNNQGTVNNSYANGNVSGGQYIGGLVGGEIYGAVVNSFYCINYTTVNDKHYVTSYGIYKSQFNDWLNNNKTIDIGDHLSKVSGTQSYNISSITELKAILPFSTLGGYDFIQTSDINLSSDIGFYVPILKGNYEGSNFFISNLNVSYYANFYKGMFGRNYNVIQNLRILDCNVWGYDFIGGLVGYNYGTINNSYATGNVSGERYVGGLVGCGGKVSNSYTTVNVSGEDYVGGLVGHGGTFLNCYATGNVSGDDSVGGLVGQSYGTVENCFASGNVKGEYWYVGGFVGYNGGTINNSYATGNVSGDRYVGGLVGESGGIESHSYAISNVSGDSMVGGFVGFNWKGTVSNSYSIGSVSGIWYVGGFVGSNCDTVENCYATDNVTGGIYVGGLVGANSGTVSNCFATGNLNGTDYVGGLVGYNIDGTVNNSFATGNVSGDAEVGGLVGYNDDIISDCYATGDINGDVEVGGLVGDNDAGTVKNCYSVGKVMGNTFVGGFCGSNGGTISNCFFDNQTSGMTTSSGGTGKNSSMMKTKGTFTDAGWDFVNTWGIIEGYSYPFFQRFNYTLSIGIIVGSNNENVNEDEMYMTDYDIYIIETNLPGAILGFASSFPWSLSTNASFLSIDNAGILKGTPQNDDVGVHYVNISIELLQMKITTYTNFTLIVHNTNDVPYIMTSPTFTATEEVLYNYSVVAGDDDLNISVGENLSYCLDSAPDGMSIDTTTGFIQWLPTNAQACQNHTVIVNVTDIAEAFDTQEFTINVTNTNDDPVITSTAITTALEDEIYEYQFTAIDDDFLNPSIERLTFSLDTAPAGMTVDPDSGLVRWLPTNDNVGVHQVSVTVFDLALANNYQNFTFTVINVNDPPVINSEPILEATTLDLYEYQLNVTDVDKGDILTYSLDTSPNNMTVNSSSGLITWIPDPEQIGDNSVIVRVSDSNTSDTQEFNIKVYLANYAPEITSEPVKSAFVGELYSYEVLAEDVNLDDVLKYSLVEHPNNMYIDPGYGIIFWKPSQDQLGRHTVTVNVSDGKLFAIQTFEIEVTFENIKPIVTSIPKKTIKVGEKYSYQVVASDADIGDMLTFQLEKAPAGMMINSTGMIIWVPIKDQVGKHIISLNVSDGKDNVSIEFTVNVEKEDSTSNGFDPTIMASIIIVIIVIIVLLPLAIILMKRKKAQKDKDKSAPLDVPDQEVQNSTDDESTIPTETVEDTSQLGTTPVSEMTGSQLQQIHQAQPPPQLPPATAHEPAPIIEPEIQSETETPSVEAPIMETEPQPEISKKE
jgi:hypothetical protein